MCLWVCVSAEAKRLSALVSSFWLTEQLIHAEESLLQTTAEKHELQLGHFSSLQPESLLWGWWLQGRCTVHISIALPICWQGNNHTLLLMTALNPEEWDEKKSSFSNLHRCMATQRQSLAWHSCVIKTSLTWHVSLDHLGLSYRTGGFSKQPRAAHSHLWSLSQCSMAMNAVRL